MKFLGFLNCNRKVWGVTIDLWRKLSQNFLLWPMVAVRMSAFIYGDIQNCRQSQYGASEKKILKTKQFSLNEFREMEADILNATTGHSKSS